jgi:hypothetical protein
VRSAVFGFVHFLEPDEDVTRIGRVDVQELVVPGLDAGAIEDRILSAEPFELSSPEPAILFHGPVGSPDGETYTPPSAVWFELVYFVIDSTSA